MSDCLIKACIFSTFPSSHPLLETCFNGLSNVAFEQYGKEATTPVAAFADGKRSAILTLVTESGETIKIDATARTISGKNFVLQDCSISKGGFAGAGWKDGKSFAVSGQLKKDAYSVNFISSVGRDRTERVVLMKVKEAVLAGKKSCSECKP